MERDTWVPLNEDDYIRWDAWQCGNCGKIVRLDEKVKVMPYKYCPYCGFEKKVEEQPEEFTCDDECDGCEYAIYDYVDVYDSAENYRGQRRVVCGCRKAVKA